MRYLYNKHKIMDDKINNLKITKIIQEYTFLKSDEEYKKELINLNQQEFLDIINQKLSIIEPSKIKQVDNQPQSDRHKILSKINSESLSHNEKVKLKKIYREIVKLTHPDKVEDKGLNETYINAKNAYEQYDLFELYFIGKSLKIYFKLTLEETRILNELIDVKKEDILKLERSFVWLWINAKSDIEKIDVVNSFIKAHYLL